MKQKSIMFQIPGSNIDTPSAVNVWTVNMAKACSFAGLNSTIYYVGDKPSKRRVKDGVTLVTMPFLQTWMLRVPKTRTILNRFFQRKMLSDVAGQFDIVTMLGGQYPIEHEMKKLSIIHNLNTKSLRSIMENPKVCFGTKEDRVIDYCMRAVVNEYDYVITITKKLYEYYNRYGRKKPMQINPIIVDTDLIRSSGSTAKQEMKRFMYSGNIQRDEEIRRLLEAFKIASKQHNEISLAVVGGGNSFYSTRALCKNYESICNDLEIEDKVQFYGKVSYAKVLELYMEADAFLSPRPFREYSSAGFPTKLGEYLSTGKPVITTGTGDIPRYLQDGVSAYVVMDNDIENFADKIIYSINDTESHKIGCNGAELAKKYFSIEATALRMKSLLLSNVNE